MYKNYNGAIFVKVAHAFTVEVFNNITDKSDHTTSDKMYVFMPGTLIQNFYIFVIQ